MIDLIFDAILLGIVIINSYKVWKLEEKYKSKVKFYNQ